MIRRSSSVGSCEAPSMAAASCVRPASFASRTICMTALASPVSASFISFCTSASNLVTFRMPRAVRIETFCWKTSSTTAFSPFCPFFLPRGLPETPFLNWVWTGGLP